MTLSHRLFSSLRAVLPRAAALGLLAAALPTSAGCGGIGPGDYVMYRVALSAPEPGKDCILDDDDTNDSSTILTSETFILYAGPDDKFYLDVGSVTLEGTEDGDGYKFTGKAVDVEFLGGGQGDKVTSTVSTTLTMTVDGAAVSGELTSKVVISYACAVPTQCPEGSTCTRTTTFVGAEIEDVELQHDPG